MEYTKRERRQWRTAIPWIERDQYQQLISLLKDGNQLPESYDEWLKHAEKNMSQMARSEYIIHKVDIDMAVFPSWCKTHSLTLNREAILRFANIRSREHFEK